MDNLKLATRAAKLMRKGKNLTQEENTEINDILRKLGLHDKVGSMAAKFQKNHPEQAEELANKSLPDLSDKVE